MIYVAPINKFHETTDPTVLNILIDDSHSMTPLRERAIVTRALNEVMIPGLEGSHKKRKDVLRVAMGAFSGGKIQSLTRAPGYFTLAQLKQHPITNDCFGGPELNNTTALYASMVSGIQSLMSAARIVKEKANSRTVRATLIVLTDGYNETDDSTTPDDVRRALKASDPAIGLRACLAYFRTGVGIDRKKFIQIARACGIDDTEKNCHFWADHEDQEKAFRRLTELLSREY